MTRGVCIKAGSYCPICRGIVGGDCWHESSQFHAGSSYLNELLKAKDRISQLESRDELLRDLITTTDCLTQRAETAERRYAELAVVGERLVAGLDKTNWSSWQTTVYFQDELEALRNALTGDDSHAG